MDKLHLMNVFVAVAEEEGFAAGARRLGLSAPAVTRAVAALEDDLGIKLLNRTTRYVRTTEVGLRYLNDAKGFVIDKITENSPAQIAGIELGDIVYQIDEQPITDIAQALDIIAETRPNTELLFKIYRKGKAVEAKVTIVELKN